MFESLLNETTGEGKERKDRLYWVRREGYRS